MPTPQEEQVNANIEILIAMQFEGMKDMDPVARQNLMDALEKVKDEYQVAVEKGKQWKSYKDAGDAIAKSLPALVKGALSASDAFKKGDYITGSAALMDICASVIPLFASLLSAGGPEGAVIGALLSVIGQILSYFAPKQPSLEEKIKKMLDHLQSEEQVQKIAAVGHAISSYTNSLRTKCSGIHTMGHPMVLSGTVSLTPESNTVTGIGTSFMKDTKIGRWLTFDNDSTQKPYKIVEIASDTSLKLAVPYAGLATLASPVMQFERSVKQRGIAEILAMPLITEEQAGDFLVEMKELNWGLVLEQQKLDVPVFAEWEVAAYLERQENHRKDGWPEVLGVWCRAYAELLSANMMLACLADPETLKRLINETQESNKQSPLSRYPFAKAECHTVLLNLKAVSSMLRHSWESDKKEMLKIVQGVRPAAKERGLYAHLAPWQSDQVLYVATGNGSRSNLDWKYKKNTAWLSTISLHLPGSQRDSFAPKYELLTCETRTNAIGRHTIDSVTGDLFDTNMTISPREDRGDQFIDVSGMAIRDESQFKDQTTLVTIAVHDKATPPYACVNLYSVGNDNKSTRIEWEPHIPFAGAIRSISLPVLAVADDPDAGALADSNANPAGPTVVKAIPSIIYGGTREGDRLWMIVDNSWADIGLPQHWSNYNGIEVDTGYFWVFGKGGIACATHASMIKFRQGKISQPNWIYHDFDKQFSGREVNSLSPCADGTLVACLKGAIYTADYEIDRKKNRILTSAWLERGGNAKQVIKLPIPCWSVLESLKANLQAS